MKQTIDGETLYSVYGTGGDLLYRDNITTGEETINLTLGSRPVAHLITQGCGSGCGFAITGGLKSARFYPCDVVAPLRCAP